ncbi:MAG: glutamate--tRNA ligase [Micrococcales bacterium]|nr:glutamate--tRNA ligase [Micrococcales bacterium]
MTDLHPTAPRLRLAPSPTGDPHVGTAYMALFNLAFARKSGGQLVLRIEDTDQNRYDANSEAQIIQTLRWLGLKWDEGPDVGGSVGPYRQSERLETYWPFVDQLLEQGQAYRCWCSQARLANLRVEQATSRTAQTGYDRLCLGRTREERAGLPGFSPRPVIRMRIPDDVELSFPDLIRGQLTAPPPDDQVIVKADGFPTYHLAVVVDDHLMGITHVVRGEEWISSTPKHLLLYRWLGWQPPAFAHMPLLRNTDRSKISKRNNPAASLTWFQAQGYLPQALVNFLQLMGYPPVHPDQEVASLEEFITSFAWSSVNPAGPIFDLDKLNWLGGHYIRALPPEELARRIAEHWAHAGQGPAGWQAAPADRLTGAAPLIQERLTTLSQAAAKLQFLYTPDQDLVFAQEAIDSLKGDLQPILAATIGSLEAIPSASWQASQIEAALRQDLIEVMELKPRVAFAPIRTAISGQKVSPPLFESMELLGQDSCLTRLRALAESLPS